MWSTIPTMRHRGVKQRRMRVNRKGCIPEGTTTSCAQHAGHLQRLIQDIPSEQSLGQKGGEFIQ